MKNIRNSLFYIVITGVFSGLIYFILINGKSLEHDITEKSGKFTSAWDNFIDVFKENLNHPLAVLLLQIVVIVIVAKLFGELCKKIGQPSVVGEMIAGILLGPSLIGHYFPEFSGFIFPKDSLRNLQLLSQIGLILFMFIVGLELDLKTLKNRTNDAVVISHASIVFPFALGVGVSYYLYEFFAPVGVNFLSFSLFMGVAMSITAFPVLARIVQERNLQKTKLGVLVITCAAVDDITAWCILAAVIAIVKAGSVTGAVYIVGLSVLYVLLMLKIVKPFIEKISLKELKKGILSKRVIAIIFLTVIVSAYLTEAIGIHALFGAFLAGVIIPEDIKFREVLTNKVEDLALVLLLPLFFVYTGLRTQIGLLNNPELYKIAALVICVAVVGKFIGSAIAAKYVGQDWRTSLSIGALMNTRGLMELVVLNIGYDLGVLSPEIFSIMVMMALVTTFMTGPLLDFINYLSNRKTY